MRENEALRTNMFGHSCRSHLIPIGETPTSPDDFVVTVFGPNFFPRVVVGQWLIKKEMDDRILFPRKQMKFVATE